MQEDTLAQRIDGCLRGLIVGEALGAPLRYLKGAHIQQVYGRIEGYVDPETIHKDRPGRWMPRGMHSYPSQLALLGCEAVLTSDDPAAEFSSLLERFSEIGEGPFGLFREITPELKASMRRLRGEEAPPPVDTLDASAAIAIIPLAIQSALRHTDIDINLVIQYALALSTDLRSIVSSIVFANALSIALQGGMDNNEGVIKASLALVKYANEVEEKIHQEYPQLLTGSPEIDAAASQCVELLPGLLREKNDDLARRSIAAEGSRHHPSHPFDDPQYPFAPANITWALYLVMRTRRFDEPVATAVSGGRDTNFLGALCGAVAGARLGANSIPPEWWSGLLARELVSNRVRAMIANDPGPLYEIDLFEAEEEWSRVLETGRRKRFEQLEEAEKRRQQRQEKKKPKPSPAALPPSTYAQRTRMPGPSPDLLLDPDEMKKLKAQRSKKRIDWKEGRKKDRRE